MKTVFVLSILFITSSCGLHKKRSGYYGKQVTSSGPDKISNSASNKSKYETDAGLLITGKMNRNLSSEFFGMIDFNFKNNTDQWIVIDKIIVNFGDTKINKNVTFVSGAQLKHYFASIEEILKRKRERARKNKQMTAAVMSGLAVGLSGSGNNYNNLATSMAIGAATSLSISQFNNSSKKLDTKNIFPDGHLLHSEFIIPPGLNTKKWLLVNSKNHKETGYIDTIYLIYKTKKGKKEKIQLSFRSGGGIKTWQSKVRRQSKRPSIF